MADGLVPMTPPGPADGEPAALPAIQQHGRQIAVSVQPEALLLAGDPAEIAAYVERVRGAVGHAVDVAGVDKASLGNATGLAAGAAAFLGVGAVNTDHS
ncbi:hypothetical protein [Mycolicibacterium gilvum]|uniref:hypothetical protein n=1 Tax=Mycolicibacterium gilvum TaxID=1804 RepID=UPI004045BC08